MDALALGYIDSILTQNHINYEFGQWSKKPSYPYFVGEFNEVEPTTEDGLEESTFIMTGFTRGKLYDLLLAKDTIKGIFGYEGITSILTNGNGLAISYGGSSVLTTGDSELKKIQINLNIKEWKVV